MGTRDYWLRWRWRFPQRSPKGNLVAVASLNVILAATLPDLLDPMYWLGDGGLFGSAVLAGVMVIIFIETGLFFPFLPGDTLLFTAGVIAAQSAADLDIWALLPCATIAAILGSQCGYLIGRRIGPRLFGRPDSRLFKQRYLTSSHEFFEKYGSKTLMIAPFIGVVRTFTPVVAGISAMRYPMFLTFNTIGCAAWGVGLPLVGYFLGNVWFIQQHLELLVLTIACLSSLPVIVSVTTALLARRRGNESS